jgi:hypothetical protein
MSRTTMAEYLKECAAAEELRAELSTEERLAVGDQSRAARARWNRKVKKRAAEMAARKEES